MLLKNPITTIQNVSNLKDLIENSPIKFDFQLPPTYVNFLKILAYPESITENYARPVSLKIQENYQIFNEDQKQEFKIPQGKYYIAIYPDIVLTPELAKFTADSSSAMIYNIIMYNIETKKITLAGKTTITNKLTEYYRNIVSFITFSEKIPMKTTFTKVPFKPILSVTKESQLGDNRLLSFFENLNRMNLQFKLINEVKELRYVSPLTSLDIVGLVDNQYINIKDVNGNKFYNQLKSSIYTSKSAKDIETETGLTTRLFTFFLNNISKSILTEFSSIPLVPCLLLETNLNKDVTAVINTKMELLKYTDSLQNYAIMDRRWLELVQVIVKIFKICYFMNIEEIISMLIKNNGINVNIPEEKDRNFLTSLIRSPMYKSIISVLIQVWQFKKMESDL